MAQAIPAPLFHTEPGSERAPSELDIARLENPVTDIDFAGPLQAGMTAGRSAVKDVQEAEDLEKAREFEQILQAGLPAMQQALEEMAEDYDVSQVRDPRLYARTKDDVANWYAGLKRVKDKQDQVKAIQEDRPEDAVLTGIERGDVKVDEGVKEIGTIKKARNAQEAMVQMDDMVRTITVNKNLASVIRSGEGGYFAFNAGKAGDRIGKQMPDNVTIGEIRRRQALPKGDPNRWFAVGAYQFVPKTLEEVLAGIPGITDDTVFTQELQDKLFAKKAAGMDAMEIAETWAAVGVPYDITRPDGTKIKKGESYHKGVGNNKASIPSETIQEMLDAGDEGLNITVEQKATLREQLERMAEDARIGGFSDDPAFVKAFEQKLKLLELDTKKEVANAKAAAKKAKSDLDDGALGSSLALIRSLADNVKPSGRIMGFAKQIAGWAGFMPNVSSLDAFSGLIAGQIAKRIGGESGRLTDQDRIFALRTLPKVNDTEEEREIKDKIFEVYESGLRGKALSDAMDAALLELGGVGKSGRSKVETVNLNKISESDVDSMTDEQLDALEEKLNKAGG